MASQLGSLSLHCSVSSTQLLRGPSKCEMELITPPLIILKGSQPFQITVKVLIRTCKALRNLGLLHPDIIFSCHIFLSPHSRHTSSTAVSQTPRKHSFPVEEERVEGEGKDSKQWKRRAWVDRWINRWGDECVNGWWTYSWWTSGQVDEWTDGGW